MSGARVGGVKRYGIFDDEPPSKRAYVLEDENGNRYEGGLKDGVPHGFGKCTSSTSTVEGTWDRGKIDNGCVMLYNGDTYNGDLRDCLPNGEGEYNSCDGIYVGSFVDGIRSGIGTLKYKDGNKFTGEWEEDVRRKGTMTYKDGPRVSYEGAYKEDKEDGKGKLEFRSGDRYEGLFEEGRMHGRGVYTHDKGDVYNGEFRNDMSNGIGKYTYANNTEDKSNYYEGSFSNNLANGWGTRVYKNGDMYVGCWKNNKRHGEEGRMKYNADIQGTFIGKWHEDKRVSGKMELYRNGSIDIFTSNQWNDDTNECKGDIIYGSEDKIWRYIGSCKNYKREGIGKMLRSNTTFSRGTWVNDRLRNGIIYYPDGCKYEGELLNDYPHGKGKYTHRNKDEYIGDFINGVSCGEGEIIYNKGGKYKGGFSNNKYHGSGTRTLIDGTRIEGTWNDGILTDGEYLYDNGRYKGDVSSEGCSEGCYQHGNGTQVYNNGDEYVGSWVKGRSEGHGIYTAGNLVYKGNWKDGLSHGAGTIYYSDDGELLKITGEWIKDKPVNDCKIEYRNGDIYLGNIREEEENNDIYQPHGQGIMNLVNGSKIICEWKYGKIVGIATVNSWSRDKYVGEVEDGKPHGNGTFTWENRDKYVGEFKSGRPDGMGCVTYDNDSTWEGMWKNGLMHGQGTWCRDDRKCKGTWMNGMRNGQCIWVYPDGRVYDGSWTDDKRSGDGTLKFDGHTLMCEWQQDKPVGVQQVIYPNGGIYIGNIYDSEKNVLCKEGKGKYTHINNETSIEITGEWNNNVLIGDATIDHQTKNIKFIGKINDEWRPDGAGIFINNVGEYKGRWKSDGTPDGRITITYKNRDTYVGDVKDLKPHGDGTYKSNNATYVGEWRDGKKYNYGNLFVDGQKLHYVVLND